MARLRKDVANVWLRGCTASRLWTACVCCGSDADFVVDYGSPDEDSQSFRCNECGCRWRAEGGRLVTDG